MLHLRDALAEISLIRSHLARGAEFHGYGPTTHAATGLLAFAAAAAQHAWVPHPTHTLASYLALWIAVAVVALTLIGIETVTRARRIHSGLAMEMLHLAVEQFLPAIVAGVLLTAVLLRFAHDSAWMLPGLWQVLFSLGVFASCRFLPRATFAVGVWYLAMGMTCLAFGRGDLAFSPWQMGIGFGVGQLLVAAILQFRYRESHEQI